MPTLQVHLRQKLSVCASMLLIASCHNFPNPVPTLTAVSRPNPHPYFATDTISVSNARLLSEIVRFPTSTNPIVAIGINPDMTILTTVDLAGHLKQFQMGSHVAFVSKEIAPVSLRATSLTSSTNAVITAAGVTSNIDPPGYATNLAGARIWDAQSGAVIAEIDATSSPSVKYADVSLSNDSEWLAAVEGASHQIFSVKTGERIYQDAFSEDGTNFAALEAVAFDPSGNYLAVASGSGSVWLYDFDPTHPYSNVLKSRMRLAEPRIHDGLEGSMVKPLDIAFDPTRKWLAVVFEDELSIYDLGNYGRYLHAPMYQSGPAAQVVFDPTGSLLAVGTKSGWKIWDVKSRTILYENSEIPVYSLSFSPDGRILVLGDTSGFVHIWGVPNK